MDKLEADLNQFRKAFNERILLVFGIFFQIRNSDVFVRYFRQLQELSDTVVEGTWETTLEEAIQNCKAEQADLDGKINTSRARRRYLDHLAKNQEQGMEDEDDGCCILCRCDFTRGYITPW